MGWLDRVPRAGRLYIGGLHALIQKEELFKEAGITHILSVLNFDLYEAGHFKAYNHMQVKLEDDPNEILLKHFTDTNQFIDSALSNDGAVFVHCAMGKSRSATVVCAYLMWRYGLTPAEALNQLCEGRPICSPNPGFMEQLQIYANMLLAKDETQSERIYQDWLRDRYTGDVWAWEQRQKSTKL